MGGAPRCSGTAGDLIALLDGCLINGFNLLAPSSVVVASGVATANFAAPHGFVPHQVIRVAGASPNELNGEARVVSVASNSLTFATTAADGTASGSISIKAAPIGDWEKVFSGTNKAVYRSSDVTGNRAWLRVDDSATTTARARFYESMTDVDTGEGPMPTVAQSANGAWWPRSDTAGTTARSWALVGDGKLFFLGVRPAAADSSYACSWWVAGEIVSYKTADGYGAVLLEAMDYYGYNSRLAYFDGSIGNGFYVQRTHTQLGSAVGCGIYGCRLGMSSGVNGLAYPSPVDNGLMVHRGILLVESGAIRGELPGLLQIPQNVGTALPQATVDAGFAGFDGRLVGVFRMATPGWGTGAIGFDLTGPWRS
jgi:hypothetical protein